MPAQPPRRTPGRPSDGPGARAWWTCFEPIHAVTYFAPECRETLMATGLRGFWMGYFAARSAPLGAAGPAVVQATFFSFHERVVRRSIPDAWTFADPSSILRARSAGAAAALRRLAPSVDEWAGTLIPMLDTIVGVADSSGRALFGANRELVAPDDPVEALWQGCTDLREHRGDGHVAALTASGLDGCEALVLFAGSEGIAGSVFQTSRGWSPDEWEAARGRLESRGLMEGAHPSPAGLELRRWLEQVTDELAAPPFASLAARERSVLLEGLRTVTGSVIASGTIPFPNPIGLPALTQV